MRIILEDGFATETSTGIGRHTSELFKYLRASEPDTDVHIFKKAKWWRRLPPSVRRPLYICWLETAFQWHLEKDNVDIVHFTNYLVPRARQTKARYVVTIHDLAAWRVPETLPPIYLRYLQWATSRAVRRADLILTVSDSVRQELIDSFRLDPGRVRTVYNFVPSQLLESQTKVGAERATHVREKFGLRKPFILFVGTLEKRKNLLTLARAFARVAPASGIDLVLVGRPGYGFKRIRRWLEKQAHSPIVVGFLSDEDLAILYQMAELFVYPSLYEGFGIPLVEAMGFGVPIVASRIGSTEEVVGDAALYYEDPFDDCELAKKISEALGRPELRRELITQGKVRAADFSWDRVGRLYCDAYAVAMNV